MPIKYMGQCSEHKASFVPNICSEVELFRTYKLPYMGSEPRNELSNGFKTAPFLREIYPGSF